MGHDPVLAGGSGQTVWRLGDVGLDHESQLHEDVALVRRWAWRTIGQGHDHVQLLGKGERDRFVPVNETPLCRILRGHVRLDLGSDPRYRVQSGKAFGFEVDELGVLRFLGSGGCMGQTDPCGEGDLILVVRQEPDLAIAREATVSYRAAEPFLGLGLDHVRPRGIGNAIEFDDELASDRALRGIVEYGGRTGRRHR